MLPIRRNGPSLASIGSAIHVLADDPHAIEEGTIARPDLERILKGLARVLQLLACIFPAQAPALTAAAVALAKLAEPLDEAAEAAAPVVEAVANKVQRRRELWAQIKALDSKGRLGLKWRSATLADMEAALAVARSNAVHWIPVLGEDVAACGYQRPEIGSYHPLPGAIAGKITCAACREALDRVPGDPDLSGLWGAA